MIKILVATLIGGSMAAGASFGVVQVAGPNASPSDSNGSQLEITYSDE